MSVYLDIKSLNPHLKVNWNVLMCKICIARRLVVDIFPWCNANFVPFPSGTLVARRMQNGRIAQPRLCRGPLCICLKGTFREISLLSHCIFHQQMHTWILIISGSQQLRYFGALHDSIPSGKKKNKKNGNKKGYISEFGNLLFWPQQNCDRLIGAFFAV